MSAAHECAHADGRGNCLFYDDPHERRRVCADLMRRGDCPFMDHAIKRTETPRHAHDAKDKQTLEQSARRCHAAGSLCPPRANGANADGNHNTGVQYEH